MLVAVPGRVDRQGGDVAVVGDEHQAAVADDASADPRDEVDAACRGSPARSRKRPDRPRPRVHLLLDAQHRPEVAAAHRPDA